MKNKSFKLLLCEVDRQRQRSQLLAIAFIPLADLVRKAKTSGQCSDLRNRFGVQGKDSEPFDSAFSAQGTREAPVRLMVRARQLCCPEQMPPSIVVAILGR